MNWSEPLGEPLMTATEAEIFNVLRASRPLTEADRQATEIEAWVQAMSNALHHIQTMKRTQVA
jgi:hypothetical protein